jgi:indolepyruvate ferredoxin oxidoreductase, beta subunit
MKIDIVLSGVGGQGILSIAASIGLAAIHNGLSLKQAEVHGMSQRGGSVQSHLRLSSSEVASDLIPMGEADMILSIEPMEALRYLPWLSPTGYLVSNTAPFINIPSYPDEEEILSEVRKVKNHKLINANQIAAEIGSPRSSNMVILGAASNFLNIPEESFLFAIEQLFSRKGIDIVRVNQKAFLKGKSM